SRSEVLGAHRNSEVPNALMTGMSRNVRSCLYSSRIARCPRGSRVEYVSTAARAPRGVLARDSLLDLLNQFGQLRVVRYMLGVPTLVTVQAPALPARDCFRRCARRPDCAAEAVRPIAAPIGRPTHSAAGRQCRAATGAGIHPSPSLPCAIS